MPSFHIGDLGSSATSLDPYQRDTGFSVAMLFLTVAYRSLAHLLICTGVQTDHCAHTDTGFQLDKLPEGGVCGTFRQWHLILCHLIITPPRCAVLLLHVFVRSWTTQPTTPSLITAFHLSGDTETRVLVLTSLELSGVVLFLNIYTLIRFLCPLCAQLWDGERSVTQTCDVPALSHFFCSPLDHTPCYFLPSAPLCFMSRHLHLCICKPETPRTVVLEVWHITIRNYM